MGCILIEYSKILHSRVMLHRQQMKEGEIAAVMLKHVIRCIEYIFYLLFLLESALILEFIYLLRFTMKP